jgi:outer membrane receptor protein involved in Fe transport
MAAFLLWMPLPVAAQATASVVGTVRDQSGAAVVGARVAITNVQTGLVESRQTAEDGSYSIPFLPVGQYQLAVEAAGFQTYRRTGVALSVNDRPTLDVNLQLGNVSESVTITAAAPLLEAQTSTLRGLVDQQRIVNLPLNGRDMTQLLTIQAGVIKTADSSSTGEGVAFAVNGSRQNGVYYLLDGGYNTSTYRNYSGTFPNPDAVEEFSVQRSNFSAEYANATGAVVNVVTKSGTNQFHGSLFEFVRNSVFNARNFFAAQRDSLKRNQYGGAIGGPVRRDRLFFFFGYQGTKVRSNPNLSVQYLPTTSQRIGDFSATAKALKDPLTGQSFPGNLIPASRVNSVTQAFLKYLPDLGSADGRRQTGAPTVTNANEYTGRVDWLLGAHRLSGKYFVTTSATPFSADANDIAYPLRRDDRQPYRQLTISDLATFSPTLINNATFAYRYRARLDNWGSFEYPINYQSAGIKGVASPKPAGLNITVSGFFTATPSWPYEIEDGDLQWSDTLTYLRGRHQFKFGGEIIHSRNQIRNQYRQFGNYTFNGSISGNAMADFMLGEVYQFWQGGGEYKDLSGNRIGFFVQDDYRATPNLTLNLGLRWDPVLPFEDSLGRVQCFVPGAKSTRFPKAPTSYLSAGDTGCPAGGFDSYLPAIAPRFGFAWRPGGGKTVARGGYGMFWNPQFTALYNSFVNSAPFSPQITNYGVKFENPYGSVANPFPSSFAPFNPPSTADFVTPLGQFGVFGQGFRPSYMETFNFTLERELTGNMVGRASYIGNLGRHLAYARDDNFALWAPGASTVANIQQRRSYKDFGSILNGYSDSTSSYHALQLTLERRVAGGLSFEANYTFSKTIDEASADPTPGQTTSIIPYARWANRGVADFDIQHRFVASSVYALPKLSRQATWLQSVAGGWLASGIATLRSGMPFSVSSGVDNSFSGIGADRADLIGDPYLDPNRSRAALIQQYFNPAAFRTNTAGTFGTAPRNFMRGPGAWNLDLALMKTFALREHYNLQFRAEFFNALNRANLNSPYAVQSNASRFGRIESASDGRIMQFALKLSF